MTKVTKQSQKLFLKHALKTNSKWAQRGLILIFQYQTTEEQEWETTNVYNNVGFTGADAEILSSIAKSLMRYRSLTPKQDAVVRKKMPKYWRQLMNLSDKVKLEEATRNWLNSRLFA